MKSYLSARTRVLISMCVFIYLFTALHLICVYALSYNNIAARMLLIGIDSNYCENTQM